MLKRDTPRTKTWNMLLWGPGHEVLCCVTLVEKRPVHLSRQLPLLPDVYLSPPGLEPRPTSLQPFSPRFSPVRRRTTVCVCPCLCAHTCQGNCVCQGRGLF